MFKTMIEGKEVKVTFQHQRAAHVGQLTRPGRLTKDWDLTRVAVYGVSFCFFDDRCVGIAYCSYSDRDRYSKETGRVVSLKNALGGVLERSGKNDIEGKEGRARVWLDYYATKQRQRSEGALIDAIKRIANKEKQEPALRANVVPWELGGQRSAMDDETQTFLNNEESR
jgi:hypothetical protein